MSFKTRLFHASLLPWKCNLFGVGGNSEHFLCISEFLGFQFMAPIPTVAIMIRDENQGISKCACSQPVSEPGP